MLLMILKWLLTNAAATHTHLPDGQSCEFLASIDMIYFFGILMTWRFQKST